MANEITASGSLKYDDGDFDVPPELLFAALQISVTTKKVIGPCRMTVTVAELAIPLGNLTTIGWGAFKNLDATNFIELRVATGGVKFCKLKPGEFAIFRFGSGVTAPFALADTANCDMGYLIAAI